MLGGNERHELSCTACGAPLHDLKMLRKEKAPKKKAAKVMVPPKPYKKPKKKKLKKRKGLMHKFFDEAWDVVEDIFD